MIQQTNNKMIAISKAPYITFHNVPRESVVYALHLKLLEKAYEKPLRLKSMEYDGDDMEAVTVMLEGKYITVALGRVGISYDLKFQMIETSKPVCMDQGLFNRVR